MHAINKVASNTAILYTRMLLTIGISLYSTRIVLNQLGDTDYGIFNLIGAVVAMLAFLNIAMSSSTQRYLSFFQGRNEEFKQRKVFINSFFLHLTLSVLIVLLLEVARFFIFNGFLNIPPSRIDAAKTIYQYVAISIFFTIISSPFLGVLNSHENMMWIAVVSIVEVLLKLGTAAAITLIHTDKLVVFGLLNACISLIIFLLYCFYCRVKYSECKKINFFLVEKKMVVELSSFAGWNLFGTFCGLGRIQGIALILNLFLGATINAAYGIANQVSSQLNFFSSAMLQALNPQIMKSEGAGDRNKMLDLAAIASKFGYSLLAVIAIPCIFEMSAILTIWLKNVPANTIIFCRFILISALINQLTVGLQSAVQATGKIKTYQAVVGSTILLNIPIAFLLLKLHFQPYTVVFSFSVIEIVAGVIRIKFLNKIAGLSIKQYLTSVIYKLILPSLSSILICIIVTNWLESVNYRFLATFFAAGISFISVLYFYALTDSEKYQINKIIQKITKRKFHKTRNVLPKLF